VIEIGAALLITACMIAFLSGANGKQARPKPSYYARSSKRDLPAKPTQPQVMSQVEADFYAAYTYQETGEPSAFMLFDHEEPDYNPSVSTPVPPQRSRSEVKPPKPKPKPVTNNDSQRIKDLERQLAQLQRTVNTQQQKPVKKEPKVHPLHQDCVDALVAVGYNKTEAKKIVKNVLTDSVTSIQDFLSIAMRKA
jgi:hypothetical protein